MPDRVRLAPLRLGALALVVGAMRGVAGGAATGGGTVATVLNVVAATSSANASRPDRIVSWSPPPQAVYTSTEWLAWYTLEYSLNMTFPGGQCRNAATGALDATVRPDQCHQLAVCDVGTTCATPTYLPDPVARMEGLEFGLTYYARVRTWVYVGGSPELGNASAVWAHRVVSPPVPPIDLGLAMHSEHQALASWSAVQTSPDGKPLVVDAPLRFDVVLVVASGAAVTVSIDAGKTAAGQTSYVAILDVGAAALPRDITFSVAGIVRGANGPAAATDVLHVDYAGVRSAPVTVTFAAPPAPSDLKVETVLINPTLAGASSTETFADVRLRWSLPTSLIGVRNTSFRVFYSQAALGATAGVAIDGTALASGGGAVEAKDTPVGSISFVWQLVPISKGTACFNVATLGVLGVPSPLSGAETVCVGDAAMSTVQSAWAATRGEAAATCPEPPPNAGMIVALVLSMLLSFGETLLVIAGAIFLFKLYSGMQKMKESIEESKALGGEAGEGDASKLGPPLGQGNGAMDASARRGSLVVAIENPVAAAMRAKMAGAAARERDDGSQGHVVGVELGALSSSSKSGRGVSSAAAAATAQIDAERRQAGADAGESGSTVFRMPGVSRGDPFAAAPVNSLAPMHSLAPMKTFAPLPTFNGSGGDYEEEEEEDGNGGGGGAPPFRPVFAPLPAFTPSTFGAGEMM